MRHLPHPTDVLATVRLQLQQVQLLRMRCTTEISNDEAIVTVPSDRTLQAFSLAERRAWCQLLADEVTTGGASPGFVEPECWQKLPWWAQLAILAKQPGSHLAGWCASLPQSFEEIPMNWTQDQLALLEYSPLLSQIEKQRQEVSAAFLEASNGVRFSFSEADFTWAVQTVRSRAFTGPYEGRGPQDRVAQLAFIAALLAASTGLGVVSLENGLNGALAAAVAIPLSDFLVGQTSTLKRHVMCPVVDYLNHDSSAVSDIAYEYFADAFAVRVNGSFQEGEEVCINYGEQRSNDTLLQFYGFVERDNANDTYTMEILQHLDVATDAIVEARRMGGSVKIDPI
ncbi:unnamed protein product [Durusdinium trenchii]|uniref:SET domain-containing protein n=1 Tax=Durusdinium trenchii TaxID=1381693 RepID=A0ABP0K2I8_9DINO